MEGERRRKPTRAERAPSNTHADYAVIDIAGDTADYPDERSLARLLLRSGTWERSAASRYASPHLKQYDRTARRVVSGLSRLDLDDDAVRSVTRAWTTLCMMRRMVDFGDWDDPEHPYLSIARRSLESFTRHQLPVVPVHHSDVTPCLLTRTDVGQLVRLARAVFERGEQRSPDVGCIDVVNQLHTTAIWAELAVQKERGLEELDADPSLAASGAWWVPGSQSDFCLPPRLQAVYANDLRDFSLSRSWAAPGAVIEVRYRGPREAVFPLVFPTAAGQPDLVIEEATSTTADAAARVTESPEAPGHLRTEAVTVPVETVPGIVKIGPPATVTAEPDAREQPHLAAESYPILNWRAQYWAGGSALVTTARMRVRNCLSTVVDTIDLQEVTMTGFRRHQVGRGHGTRRSILREKARFKTTPDGSWTIVENGLARMTPLHTSSHPADGTVTVAVGDELELEVTVSDAAVDVTMWETTEGSTQTVFDRMVEPAGARGLPIRFAIPTPDQERTVNYEIVSSLSDDISGNTTQTLATFGINYASPSPVELIAIGYPLAVNPYATGATPKVVKRDVRVDQAFESPTVLLSDETIRLVVSGRPPGLHPLVQLRFERLEEGEWRRFGPAYDVQTCAEQAIEFVYSLQNNSALRDSMGYQWVRGVMTLSNGNTHVSNAVRFEVRDAPEFLICLAKGGFFEGGAFGSGGSSSGSSSSNGGPGEATPCHPSRETYVDSNGEEFYTGDGFTVCHKANGMRRLGLFLLHDGLATHAAVMREDGRGYCGVCASDVPAATGRIVIGAWANSENTGLADSGDAVTWQKQLLGLVGREQHARNVILIGHSHGGAELAEIARDDGLWVDKGLNLALFVSLDSTSEGGYVSDVGPHAERIVNFYQTDDEGWAQWIGWANFQSGHSINRADPDLDLTDRVSHTAMDSSVLVDRLVRRFVAERISDYRTAKRST
ncbi:MAG: hypothetical protein L0K86_01055 [Actinomycetia bacterium]|nr:hypothetical protein [Actinomycetes bacterium]